MKEFKKIQAAMVFREKTILEIRSFVDKLEKEREKEKIKNEIFRKFNVSSAQEYHIQPSMSMNQHSKSCLSSGLFHAVYKGRLKKVTFLLDNGCNVNAQNNYGYSVLLAALQIENAAKRSKMFQMLLENDADPLQKDPKNKRNALSWAAVLGRVEQTSLLLNCFMGEFDYHDKDRDGMTALHLATQAGHTEVVKLLVREMIKYGTTVDVSDNLGLTPYLHAKRLGYGLIADILKVEGGACEGQGDMFSFKNAEEWRKIGIRERNEEAQRRRNNEYEQAAIAGNTRILMEFKRPVYKFINVPTHRVRHQTRSLDSKIESDESKTDRARSIRILTPNRQMVYSERKGSQTPFQVEESNRLGALNLMQMRVTKTRTASKRFRSSELDSARRKKYKHAMFNFATMMDYLSLQHCRSFRNSVQPMKLKQEESGKKSPQMSTLAIIFGKKKKGKKSLNKDKEKAGKSTT